VIKQVDKMDEQEKPLPDDIKNYLDNLVVDGLCEGIICTNEPKIDSILSNQHDYKENFEELKKMVSSLNEELQIKKQVNGVKEEETWRIRENLYDGQWKIWKKIKKTEDQIKALEEKRAEGDEELKAELIQYRESLKAELLSGRLEFVTAINNMENNIRKDMPSKAQMWLIFIVFGIIATAIVGNFIQNVFFK
jgi:hypothetical protein